MKQKTMSDTKKEMERNLLSIFVSCTLPKDDLLGPQIVIALREYADAVERGLNFHFDCAGPESNPPVCGKRAVERMIASNGCEIEILADSHDLPPTTGDTHYV